MKFTLPALFTAAALAATAGPVHAQRGMHGGFSPSMMTVSGFRTPFMNSTPFVRPGFQTSPFMHPGFQTPFMHSGFRTPFMHGGFSPSPAARAAAQQAAFRRNAVLFPTSPLGVPFRAPSQLRSTTLFPQASGLAVPAGQGLGVMPGFSQNFPFWLAGGSLFWPWWLW